MMSTSIIFSVLGLSSANSYGQTSSYGYSSQDTPVTDYLYDQPRHQTSQSYGQSYGSYRYQPSQQYQTSYRYPSQQQYSQQSYGASSYGGSSYPSYQSYGSSQYAQRYGSSTYGGSNYAQRYGSSTYGGSNYAQRYGSSNYDQSYGTYKTSGNTYGNSQSYGSQYDGSRQYGYGSDNSVSVHVNAYSSTGQYKSMVNYVGTHLGDYGYGNDNYCEPNAYNYGGESYGVGISVYDRKDTCYGGRHAQMGFEPIGRYERIDEGYCEDWGCDRVYNEYECQFAASTLDLPDMTAAEAKRLGNPAGCYYRPEYQTLWFNYRSRAPAQLARQTICYCPNDVGDVGDEPNPYNVGGEKAELLDDELDDDLL